MRAVQTRTVVCVGVYRAVWLQTAAPPMFMGNVMDDMCMCDADVEDALQYQSSLVAMAALGAADGPALDLQAGGGGTLGQAASLRHYMRPQPLRAAGSLRHYLGTATTEQQQQQQQQQPVGTDQQHCQEQYVFDLMPTYSVNME